MYQLKQHVASVSYTTCIVLQYWEPYSLPSSEQLENTFVEHVTKM